MKITVYNLVTKNIQTLVTIRFNIFQNTGPKTAVNFQNGGNLWNLPIVTYYPDLYMSFNCLQFVDVPKIYKHSMKSDSIQLEKYEIKFC